MKPIVEQGSVKVELIYVLHDSPECKVYVVQTDVKRPHVIETENGRLVLVIYPTTTEGDVEAIAIPTTVKLHEVGSRRHTTVVEGSRYSAYVVSVFHPEEPKLIYESEPQGDQ